MIRSLLLCLALASTALAAPSRAPTLGQTVAKVE